jgi:hypothetical protein
MKQQDYRKSITANVTPKAAFENIINVSGWWTNSFKGSAKNLNDVFKVSFGETKVTFKVIETIPYKKLVWQVTDCHLHWLKNKTEWNDSKIVWEISEGKNATRIDMTHLGLVPGIECYKDCEAGWNQYVGDILLKLITTGKGVIFEGSRG